MEADFFNEGNEKMEVVQGTSGSALVITPADI